MISIIVPSYGRPDKIPALLRNIQENTYVDYEVILVAEREQLHDYRRAVVDDYHAVLIENERTRNYAGAVNTGAQFTQFENIFMGADDVRFHANWDVQALEVMRALPHIKVVGTNDLFNGFVLEGLHATHYLVDSDYITSVGGVVDGEQGHVLFEGYDHNYTDTEFIGTAKARAVFAPCLTSVVEHVGWTTNEFQDDTKAKTNGKIDEDSRLYQSRQHLWQELSK